MAEGKGGGGCPDHVPLISILSPAFAEAASRRQAPRGRRHWVKLFSKELVIILLGLDP